MATITTMLRYNYDHDDRDDRYDHGDHGVCGVRVPKGVPGAGKGFVAKPTGK